MKTKMALALAACAGALLFAAPASAAPLAAAGIGVTGAQENANVVDVGYRRWRRNRYYSYRRFGPRLRYYPSYSYYGYGYPSYYPYYYRRRPGVSLYFRF